MRYLAAIFPPFLGPCTESSSAQTPRAAGLSRLLEAEAARFRLRSADDSAPAGIIELESLRERKPLGVGIYVKHLTTGEEAMVRPDEPFETQSVIKVAVMIRAYQLADAKELNLDERVVVTKDDMVFGTGVLQYDQEGFALTIRDLITEMIITSDNTATDLVLARIGGAAALNKWLWDSGYVETRLATSLFESFRFPYELADPRHRALTVKEVYALRTDNPSWAGMTREWADSIGKQVTALESRPLADVRAVAKERGLPLYFGRMTPREAGRMMEGIERATLASAVSSSEMKQALLRQQLGKLMLPHFVECPVAHKTGENPPWDANAVGVIYARSGPILVAAFANDLGGNCNEEMDRIGRIARVVVQYFDGVRG